MADRDSHPLRRPHARAQGVLFGAGAVATLAILVLLFTGGAVTGITGLVSRTHPARHTETVFVLLSGFFCLAGVILSWALLSVRYQWPALASWGLTGLGSSFFLGRLEPESDRWMASVAMWICLVAVGAIGMSLAVLGDSTNEFVEPTRTPRDRSEKSSR